MNLLDRIVCDYQTLMRIRSSCECKVCKKQNTANPVYDSYCHSGVYCKDCINKTQCHNCIGQEKTNLQLYSLVKLATFKCIYSNLGCQAICTIELLESHEKGCTYGQPNFKEQVPFKFKPFIPKSEQKQEVPFSQEPYGFKPLSSFMTPPSEFQDDKIPLIMQSNCFS